MNKDKGHRATHNRDLCHTSDCILNRHSSDKLVYVLISIY